MVLPSGVDAREDGFVAGVRPSDDRVRLRIDGEKRIAAGRRGVDAAAVGGKIESVGQRADGNARD